MRDRKPKRDTDYGRWGGEPVPAATPLGTDDEAAEVATVEDRLSQAAEAERKVGDAPYRHSRKS